MTEGLLGGVPQRALMWLLIASIGLAGGGLLVENFDLALVGFIGIALSAWLMNDDREAPDDA